MHDPFEESLRDMLKSGASNHDDDACRPRVLKPATRQVGAGDLFALMGHWLGALMIALNSGSAHVGPVARRNARAGATNHSRSTVQVDLNRTRSLDSKPDSRDDCALDQGGRLHSEPVRGIDPGAARLRRGQAARHLALQIARQDWPGSLDGGHRADQAARPWRYPGAGFDLDRQDRLLVRAVDFSGVGG